MTRTLTMDFREEYEAERTRRLRRRFLWYSGVLAAFFIVTSAVESIAVALAVVEAPSAGAVLVEAACNLPQVVIFVGAFLYVLRRPLSRPQLLKLVFALTVVTGAFAIVAMPVVDRVRLGPDEFSSARAISASLARLFGVHFLACLFIPWTPREAIRPLIPLLVIFAIVTLVVEGNSLLSQTMTILFSPLVGGPGLLICWLRHSRFRNRFHYRMLRGRYGELQRELVDAREVHEELFPEQITAGPIRMYYRYEPMRQIGGDYLYALRTPGSEPGDSHDRLNVVLLDVTGHGVKAALTVNRLYGELERLFAEDPDIPPGKVLCALNRYVSLTLAKHSVFATALCLRFRVDEDVLESANAGHPPAFLLDAAGHLERLPSTAPLLGVFGGREFEPAEESRRFAPGDALIAYTDGVIDTIDQSGQRLQIEGIQRILAGGAPQSNENGRWCAALLGEVQTFRFGATVDDTLIVEVSRPIESTPVTAGRDIADSSSRRT